MQPTTDTATPDTTLVERVQRGDHDAFTELVRRHDAVLRALARRLLRCPDRVDDALQDAYVKAYRRIGAFRSDASVATWLYRITYNTCLDELRRRPSDVGTETQLDSPAREPGPAERVVARMDADDVLARLSPELRATVVLVHGYGYEYAEASRILGVPTGTIASRLHRARDRHRRVDLAA
jgi:RNA polymerase sigma-70 factor (ECF subfamily)